MTLCFDHVEIGHVHGARNGDFRFLALFRHGGKHTGGAETVGTLDQAENPLLDRQLTPLTSSSRKLTMPTGQPAPISTNSLSVSFPTRLLPCHRWHGRCAIDNSRPDVGGRSSTGSSFDGEGDHGSEHTACKLLLARARVHVAYAARMTTMVNIWPSQLA